MGCGENIAFIGAGVNRWRAPHAELNNLRRSLTPFDPDGTLFGAALITGESGLGTSRTYHRLTWHPLTGPKRTTLC